MRLRGHAAQVIELQNVCRLEKMFIKNVSNRSSGWSVKLSVTFVFFPGGFREKQAVNELLSRYKEDFSALSSGKNQPLTPAGAPCAETTDIKKRHGKTTTTVKVVQGRLLEMISQY